MTDSSSSPPWWRAPLFHFLVLGALLLGMDLQLSEEPRETIVVSRDRIRQLVADWRLDNGVPPDRRTLENIVSKEADDELLLAHGLELGLHFEGPTARRLEELASFLGQEGSLEELVAWAESQALHRRDPEARQRLLESSVEAIIASDDEYGVGDLPPDSELEALLAEDPARYSNPARYDLTQVFVAGPALEALAQAGRLRTDLVARRAGPEAAEGVSDPSPLPVRLGEQTRRDLLLRFGDDAAAAVSQLEIGQWSKPVPAANGAHLFWLHGLEKARPLEFPEVRDRLAAEWLSLRQEARLGVALEELEARLEVRIDWPEELEEEGADESPAS